MNVEFIREDGSRGVKYMFHDAKGKPLQEILTKQSFLEECDINKVIDRHRKNGTVPVSAVNGTYGDFSEIGTFQDAQIRIEMCNNMFESLPAKVRAHFEHDVGSFLDFISNTDNAEEMKSLGLVTESEPTKDSENSESVASNKEATVGSEQ